MTLLQPWASLVALGAKQYETRSWRPMYRGALAIHSAKRFPEGARALCFQQPFRRVLENAGYLYPAARSWRRQLPLGAIVGVCELRLVWSTSVEYWPVDNWIEELSSQERAFGDYTPGRWAWRLDDLRELPNPTPARGYQFLWDVEPELLEAIAAQLEAVKERA